MLYPLFLTPYFRECVWGGDNLRKKLNKNHLKNNIGESFELSCYKNFLCKIKNGVFKNIPLKNLVDIYPFEIMGKNSNSDFFPLIIKFLDANNRLSVQVHPDDNYALKKSSSLGKNELWYVVHAEENSKIVLGLNNNISKSALKDSLKNDEIKSLLNIENVSIGDCIFIPSGTIHALLENIIVVEIQQSSDITYRLYDWNRLENGKSRKLHIDDAINVLDPTSNGKILRRNEYVGESFYNFINIKDFTVDYIKINNLLNDNPKGESFHVYVCISGGGKVIYNNIEYPIFLGDTFLIPAALSKYKILGELEVLKVYIN